MEANSHNLGFGKIQDKNTKKNGTVKANPTMERQEILLLAKTLKIDANDQFSPPEIAWQMYVPKIGDYAILGTLGNFSLITGKAKSRKTFFINIAVSCAISKDLILKRFKGNLPPEQNEVLYIDTEQGKFHVQLALKRICKQTNIASPDNLHVYSLRSRTPEERLQIIETLIYDNEKMGFVVIDGIKDLVTSINDEEQASMISSKLLKWSEERNIHIVAVLHQNKGDNNARGHLGTELINKAETVLSVTKVEKNKDISLVQPEQCRNIEPDFFAFQIIDGLSAIVDDYEIKAVANNSLDVTSWNDDLKYSLLTEVFSNNKSVLYKDLAIQIKSATKKLLNKDIGLNKAKDLITHCKMKGWLIQGKLKEPYTLGIPQNDTSF
jgi:hypothetical protein